MDPRDPNKQYRFRLRGLFALFCACMLLFFSVLYDAQVIHAQDYYRESASPPPPRPWRPAGASSPTGTARSW